MYVTRSYHVSIMNGIYQVMRQSGDYRANFNSTETAELLIRGGAACPWPTLEWHRWRRHLLWAACALQLECRRNGGFRPPTWTSGSSSWRCRRAGARRPSRPRCRWRQRPARPGGVEAGPPVRKAPPIVGIESSKIWATSTASFLLRAPMLQFNY